MKGYHGNIERLTEENGFFRQVLYTAKNSQLVVMSLKPLEEIGLEIHPDNDQFFRIESGDGKVVIDETEYVVGAGDVIIVPEGAKHNVINTSGTTPLKLYTLYCPPHHRIGVQHQTKEQAQLDKEEFDGVTSE